jgi:homoserine dehydrogenase
MWASPTPAARPLRVALFGCGVVGRGVYESLKHYPQTFEIRHVVVRDVERYPNVARLTTDAAVALDAAVDVVVVCFGDTALAHSLIAASLNAGKFVATANKAAVAVHAGALTPHTRGEQRRLWYSAAVGGALPALETLATLEEPVREIRSIINGTCGVARDSADELALMIEAAFGQWIEPNDIPTQGIDAIADNPRGYKLVARATKTGRSVTARIAPERLPPDSFLGASRGPENRLEIELCSGNVICLRAQGAGRWPTTVSVLGDLHEIARRREAAGDWDGYNRQQGHGYSAPASWMTLQASDMMKTYAPYPIGTPGLPWGEAEVATWLSRQTVKRSYETDVLRVVDDLSARYDVVQYGQLDYQPSKYPLFAVKSRDWYSSLPCALVTGGVHGYETSGVHGALRFLDQHAATYAGRINLLVAPCVSPWAYEVVHRWNMHAVDPNRSFRDDSPAQESAALMRLVTPFRNDVLVHIDLHETTETDESEFRPALAARDGVAHVPGEIPDGFYLVDDSENPQPEFQQAVLAAVRKVTHIAPPDRHGEIIGSPMVAPGVILYPLKQLGLCASVTHAFFKTTTEVYPDSSRTTPEQCISAQVAAVCAAIDFALEHLALVEPKLKLIPRR